MKYAKNTKKKILLHVPLMRLSFCHLIHNVKGKVELIVIAEADGLQSALFVFCHIDKVFVYSAAGSLFLPLDLGQILAFGTQIGSGAALAGRVKDKGVKLAVFSSHSYHAVRRRAVIINAVAGRKHLAVLAYLHF